MQHASGRLAYQVREVPDGSLAELGAWFAGYRWRIASCWSCQTHMGWRFEADSGQESPWFFLLLSRRIVPASG